MSWSKRVGASLATAVVVGWGAAAQAGGDAPVTREHRSRDILAHIDDPPDEPGWFRRHLSIDNQGVRLSRFVAVGDHRVKLSLRGPVYRGATRKTRYGARIEFRF